MLKGLTLFIGNLCQSFCQHVLADCFFPSKSLNKQLYESDRQEERPQRYKGPINPFRDLNTKRELPALELGYRHTDTKIENNKRKENAGKGGDYFKDPRDLLRDMICKQSEAQMSTALQGY